MHIARIVWRGEEEKYKNSCTFGTLMIRLLLLVALSVLLLLEQTMSPFFIFASEHSLTFVLYLNKRKKETERARE